MINGAELVLKTVKAIEENNYPSIPQAEGKIINHAPKIFKETCEIQWNKTSEEIRNFVRGLSPYPAAWTKLEGKVFKIFKVSVVKSNEPVKGSEDSFRTDNKNYLHLKTTDGWVSVDELQPEGKKRMTIQEFFRGNKMSINK
jgi:methionyl-tRNA formyltransferase